MSETKFFEVTRTNRLLESTPSPVKEWDAETKSWGPLKRPVEGWETLPDLDDDFFWCVFDSEAEALRELNRRLSDSN